MVGNRTDSGTDRSVDYISFDARYCVFLSSNTVVRFRVHAISRYIDHSNDQLAFPPRNLGADEFGFKDYLTTYANHSGVVDPNFC